MKDKRAFDNFDQFAESYREIHDVSIKYTGTNSEYFSEYKILELLKFEKSDAPLKVLDFGCGDGNSSKYIRKHFPNTRIVGVDISKKSIDQSKLKKIDNSSFHTFDGKSTTFKDEDFDFIFVSMVFHHINKVFYKEVLQELSRLLKKGGRLYVFEHNPNNPVTRKVVRECPMDKNAVLINPTELHKIISSLGFQRSKLKYTLFLPRHRFVKPFLGLEKWLYWLPLGAQYYILAIK